MSSSNEHRAANQLLERYLDPLARWSPKDSKRLTALLAQHESVRRQYDQAIVGHRMMLGLAADTPSALELRRMEAAVVEAASAPVDRVRPWWMAWGSLAAAACAIAVMWLGGLPDTRPSSAGGGGGADWEIRARGGNDNRLPEVGVGATGVTESGREYEAVHSPLFLDDYLRLETRCGHAPFRYVALVGLQPPAGTLIWYYPAKPEGQSVAVTCSDKGARTVLEDEIRVDASHRPGELWILAVFSEKPLNRSQMEAAIRVPSDMQADRPADLTGSAAWRASAEGALKRQGIPAAVQTQTIHIQAGAHREP